MKKYVFISVCVMAMMNGYYAEAQLTAKQSKDAKTAKDAQAKAAKSPVETTKTMSWTTSSSVARAHSQTAMTHLLNIEMPQAYEHFQEALKADPNFTVVQAFMSNMSFGEQKKRYATEAMKSSTNKTEGEKLFVSLLDENATPEVRRNTWAKLHEMFPDGKMVHTYYVYTRETPEERFNAAQEMLKKYPDAAWMYNILGYYYMNDKKDMANAKASFEKYISLYPDGYNPYDSMGEFYLVSGDTANAVKYYNMVLEKYPYARSALDAIEGINAAKQKK